MKLIQKQAITHYERMIAWIKNQDIDEKCSEDKILDELGEFWSSDYCSYCRRYVDKYGNCGECELSLNPNSFSCCGKLWEKLYMSSTWGEALIYTEKILDYIKKYR